MKERKSVEDKQRAGALYYLVRNFLEVDDLVLTCNLTL